MILTSLEYRPNSTIPPKMRRRTPSQMKPNAAQPVGFSPLTCGANHWFVAAEREGVYFYQRAKFITSNMRAHGLIQRNGGIS